MSKRIFLILTTTGLIAILTILGIMIPQLQDHLVNKTENFTSGLIGFLYPKFILYKSTIDHETLINRAYQVVIRFGVLLLGISSYYRYQNKFKTYFKDISFNEMLIEVALMVYLLYFLFACFEWYIPFESISKLGAFYKPIFPISLLGDQLPSPLFYAAILFLGILGLVLTRRDKKEVRTLGAIFMLITLIVFHSTFCSFGKIDHGYASLYVIALLLPFYYWSNDQRFIWLMQLGITLCYGMSGLEKVLLSGINFITPDHFKNILALHPTDLGNTISNSSFLCSLIPLLTLIIQLGAPFIFFNKKIIPFWVISAVLFHWGAYIILDIGGFHSPWVAALIIFLPYFFRSAKKPDVLPTISKTVRK